MDIIRNAPQDGRQQLVMQMTAIQMEKCFKNSLSPWQEEPQQEKLSDNKPIWKEPSQNFNSYNETRSPCFNVDDKGPKDNKQNMIENVFETCEAAVN